MWACIKKIEVSDVIDSLPLCVAQKASSIEEDTKAQTESLNAMAEAKDKRVQNAQGI